MPAKIRLQRHGKKGRPFFHIVVADGRAPRDGRFIERIGSYNPITDPATIELNVEKAADWLMNGAQPTDTTRAILSYKGVLYRAHLNKGVRKGVLSQEAADVKFAKWLEEKNAKIEGKKTRLSTAKSKDADSRLAMEIKTNEARIEAMKKKAAEANFVHGADESSNESTNSEAPSNDGETSTEA